MTQDVVEMVNGYTKNGRREVLRFRHPVDVAEMIAHCTANPHIWFAANDGTARQVKVNGAIQTWKRDPNRVRVPIKYGLYEYGAFDQRDILRILIPA